MQNYRIVLSYDGTSYHGFQLQKNALTIQEVLEKSLEKLYRQKIRVVAAGRTDSGVHARGQVVNFFAPQLLSPTQLLYALNGLLPADIVVLGAKSAARDFHARRDADAKLYSYTIDNGPRPDVFSRLYAWHIADLLDLNAMRRAAAYLLGTHDFKAFRASGSSTGTTERALFSLEIEKRGSFIVLSFKGSGFLYKMVRNITGTLVEIGLKKRPVEEMEAILKSRDRKKAGKTAPARGLCLEKVFYANNLKLDSEQLID